MANQALVFPGSLNQEPFIKDGFAIGGIGYLANPLNNNSRCQFDWRIEKAGGKGAVLTYCVATLRPSSPSPFLDFVRRAHAKPVTFKLEWIHPGGRPILPVTEYYLNEEGNLLGNHNITELPTTPDIWMKATLNVRAVVDMTVA